MAEEAVAVPAQFSVRDLADDTNYGVLSAPDKRAIFEQRARNDAQFKEAFPTKDAQELAYEHILHTIWQRASATAPGREAKPVAESPSTNPAAIPDAATRPPSTNPADVPNATTGTPSPMQAVGGVLRGLGLQGFEDTSKYPTPNLFGARQTSPEEQQAAKQQRESLPTPGPVGQALDVVGRGAMSAVSGIAGAPGDLLNTPGALSTFVGGPDFRLPIGSESAARTLGIRPESMSLLERGIQAISGAVSPGEWLKVATNAGILTANAQKLYKWISAGGTKADALFGAASFGGAEAGRQITPDSAVGPLIGGVGAALTIAGAHALIDKGVKSFGKPIIAQQDAAEAERIAMQTKREGSARLNTAQEGVTDAKDILATQQARGEVAEDAMRTDLARVKREGAESITRAETAVAETFAPLDAELRNSVLQERTTAGTPRINPQVPPGTEEVGAKALGELSDIRGTIPKEAAERGTQLLDSLGPHLERMDLLSRIRRFFYDDFFKQGRENLGKLFEATEAVTGDAPVVRAGKLQEQASKFAGEASVTGMTPPQGTGAASHFGVAKEELEALLDPEALKTGWHQNPLTPPQRKMVKDILANPEYAENFVPFWLARRMESGLNRIAYQGADPIGTITQGKARRMLSALQDDIHDFYVGDIATKYTPDIEKALQPFGGTAAESTIAGGVEIAKERYRDFIQTSNRTIVSKILSPDETVRRQFLKPFTTATGDAQVLLDIKKVASPEIWDTLGAFTLAEGHRIASASGQFDIKEMQNWLKGLRKSGKMDILFTSDKIDSIERFAQSLTTDTEGYLPTFRAALARKTPEQVLATVFNPGDITATQNYKSVISPDVFDASVKAFAADMLTDLANPQMSPVALFKKYEPFTRRGRVGGGVGHGGGEARSQLDIMLTAYPDASDRIKQVIDDFNPRTVALKKAQEASVTNTAEAERQLNATIAGSKADVVPLNENIEHAQAWQQAVKKEETTLTDFADEQLRLLKKQANIPEDAMVYTYQRVGPLHIRTRASAGAALAAASTVASVLTGQPLWMTATSALATAGLAGAQHFTGWANTPKGMQVIRQGLTGQWGPSTARWVGGALGEAAKEPAQ